MKNFDRPLFFLHIPRTGGTTVDSIFFSNLSISNILKIYTQVEYEKHRFHTIDELQNIKYITGHLLLDNYDALTLYGIPVYVFTFLREPLQRLISEYTFYKTWPNNHLYKILNERNITFSEYIKSSDKILKYRGKNFMTRCISGKSFTSGKHPYSALACAKRQLEKNFFFFGILEYFTESIILLKRKIDLENIFFEEHNKLAKGTKEKISEEDKALVYEYNRADCELYEFAKNVFLDRLSSSDEMCKREIEEFKIQNTLYQKKCGEEKIDIQEGKIILPKK